MESRRRDLLKASAAIGGLFLPTPFAWVWAQSEGALKLQRLPKIALVFGNSKYKDAPLRNPANDAKAIGEALAATGFSVTAKIDAGRAEMAAAVDAYVKELAAKKCVGLFYYAGHGVQLQWKNYMLPVDAEIDTIDDVQKKAVEVNSLTDGLVKAANPLNVIILDACRDNPFGTAKPAQQKGLSQMDAPSNTILAYATAPGNVASDGVGANGLYTENLLREIKVPEAKIEDVFKRVRLGVRRKSNGAQIPWESTSLEEDFWFIPPKNLQEPSESTKEKQFEEELALWEKIKAAASPGPLEDFLRRFPSGPFSELAQLQLDLVLAKQGEKRVEIALSAGNPFTQGSFRADLSYKVNDSYAYRVLDLESKQEKRTFTDVVSEIREGEVLFAGGLILDRLGNTIQLPDGRRYTPRQDQPIEYAIGRKWATRYSVARQGGGSNSEMEFRISRKEKITVPAGSFDCFVIEGEGSGTGDRGAKLELRITRWMAPDKVRRPIVSEIVRKLRIERGDSAAGGGPSQAGRGSRKGAGKGAGKWGGKGADTGQIERVQQSERLELVSYRQS